MAYNLKITEYANGQLEVITYKQGVYTMLDGESSYRADMIDKNVDALAWRFASYVIDEKTGQGRFIPRIEDREYCYNPFTEKIQRVYTVEDEIAEEKKKLDNLSRSFRRTRSALYMYARQCNWEYFITLTYSPDKIENRYDYSLCMKRYITGLTIVKGVKQKNYYICLCRNSIRMELGIFMDCYVILLDLRLLIPVKDMTENCL